MEAIDFPATDATITSMNNQLSRVIQEGRVLKNNFSSPILEKYSTRYL